MITHLIKSINWIDVALVILFARTIFVGVKNGFISEFFKSLGVVVAVFVSLHYYSFLAALAAQKTHLIWGYWNLLVIAVIWMAVWFFFKLLRDGVLILFKAETNHDGFDKYAAGIVAVGRGLLACGMLIFGVMLAQFGPLTRMTIHSYSYKIAGTAAVTTYSFLYNNLVGKLLTGQHYNVAAAQVLHPAG